MQHNPDDPGADTRSDLHFIQSEQNNVPRDGLMSSASSSTAIPAMRSSMRLPEEKSLKGKTSGDLGTSAEGEDDEPSGDLQAEELEKARHRSKLQSIMLVATCTTGMILNVKLSPILFDDFRLTIM